MENFGQPFYAWLNSQKERDDSVGRISRLVYSKYKTEPSDPMVLFEFFTKPGLFESEDLLVACLEYEMESHQISTSIENEELNVFAEETLRENKDVFIDGACRLFDLWTRSRVITHAASRIDSHGHVISLTHSFNYLPIKEMVKAYDCLGDWAVREGIIIEPLALITESFKPHLPAPQDKSYAKALAEMHFAPQFLWGDVVIFLFEALLQQLLRMGGWDADDLKAWCLQAGSDRPDYSEIKSAWASITPKEAISRSNRSDISPLAPDCIPFARRNGALLRLIQDQFHKFSPILSENF